MLDIAGARERTATGRVDLDIDHEDFIKNNKYQYHSKIRVRDKGYVAHWEVDPKDIQYEVNKLGVVIIQNSLAHFSQNNSKEYFIDSTTFFSFFPSSDLITLFENEHQCIVEEAEITSIGAAVDDTQFAETTINILKNEDERKKVYDQIDSVNKILLDPNLSRKEKRKLKKFLDNPETESIDFNILHQIDSARKILLYPNLSRKEKRKLKKFIKQLENEIILENN